MSIVTYAPEVRCEVSQGGLLPNGVTAVIRDVDGRPQFIQVTQNMINDHGDSTYLPVGIVNVDRVSRRVLVELPVEADSGANRMWISFDEFLKVVSHGSEVVA